MSVYRVYILVIILVSRKVSAFCDNRATRKNKSMEITTRRCYVTPLKSCAIKHTLWLKDFFLLNSDFAIFLSPTNYL